MAKKHIYDRKDASLVKDIDSMHAYMSYLMPKRTEAEVYINESFDITNLLKYLEEKNKSNPEKKITIFHCVLTAVYRVINTRPLLNRYIKRKRYYMRDKISAGFTIKKQFTDGAAETLMIMKADENDNLDTVSDRILGEVKCARSKKIHGSDGPLETLKKLPRPIMSIVMAALNFMDRYDLMPKSFMDMDTNYTSVLLSNLGSIKCDAVYHHLNNFGTNGIVITIGVIHKEAMIMNDGKAEIRDVMNIGATLDERIADGFYFARSLKLIHHLFNNPELLDKPLKEEIDFEF